MQIDVRLYGPLRDRLPRAARGRTTLAVDEGATVQSVLDRLNLPPNLLVNINDDIEASPESILNDGDLVVFFAAVSGG